MGSSHVECSGRNSSLLHTLSIKRRVSLLPLFAPSIKRLYCFSHRSLASLLNVYSVSPIAPLHRSSTSIRSLPSLHCIAPQRLFGLSHRSLASLLNVYSVSPIAPLHRSSTSIRSLTPLASQRGLALRCCTPALLRSLSVRCGWSTMAHFHCSLTSSLALPLTFVALPLQVHPQRGADG
jgi:hypothetical protein